MGTLIKAIFLDSDGVINEAVIQNGKPVAPVNLSQFVIMDEVKPCCEKFKSAGYTIFCITNKPDIKEGRMREEDVNDIFAYMKEALPITEVYACYDRRSDCFKPKPGMLLEAAKAYDIDLENSYMIGDRNSDVAAGKAAGCKTVWIDRQYAVQEAPNPPADYTTHSLTDATEWILRENDQ